MVNLKTSYQIDELRELNLNISQEEIFSNLSNENCDDFLKIFSIINIEKIDNIDQAHIFIHHLTNHSNPLREAVALKLDELFTAKKFEYYDDKILEQYLKALTDINPNICRVICNILSINSVISEKLQASILSEIKKSILKIKEYQEDSGDFFDNNIRNKKNHAKNKILFSLYWLLEGLSYCRCEKYNSEVLEILKFTINFCDYTIREKTAKILAGFTNAPYDLLQIAKNDQNFYVKNQVYDKINFED